MGASNLSRGYCCGGGLGKQGLAVTYMTLERRVKSASSAHEIHGHGNRTTGLSRKGRGRRHNWGRGGV